MNDVVFRTNCTVCKGVTYKCDHICDILNYVLCEPSHAWDLVQFSP